VPVSPPPASAATPPAASDSLLGAPPAAEAPAAPAPAAAAGEAARPADAAKPADKAPEPVALKFPAGADQATVEGFSKLVADSGVKAEQAQKIVDFYAGVQSQAQAAQQEAQQKTIAGWVTEVKADPEVAGADGKQFDANMAAAVRAVKDFGGEPLVKLLNESGLGNHPLLVKAFVAIGKARAEDRIGGTSNAAGKSNLSPDEQLQRDLYPTMFPKE
jgi:3-oxoacyl-ACP reductase-like protein